MQINNEIFVDAMSKFEIEVREYSGRAMYGDHCIGVDVDSMGEVGVIAVALMDAGVDAESVALFMKRMKWDSMGMGYIVYWPHELRLSKEEAEAMMEKEYEHELDEAEDE
jgi:hypothetical protein